MARQTPLARDDMSFGPPGPRGPAAVSSVRSRSGRLRQAGNDFAFGAAEVEIDRVPVASPR
jgi:hypothetical protein